MIDREYNLLHEKWILVMWPDGVLEKVSLTEALLNAHKYLRLAGELPTQDVAILRVLLAVLHAVFARYDLNGDFSPLLENADPPADAKTAVSRWQALWSRGSFPEEIIRTYLSFFEDRFYLFHPEHPFFQVPELKLCTEYTAAKLNGELSQSSNKLRLFPVRSGEAQSTLEYDEAARWLIYLNAYDDTSAKPQKVKGKDEKFQSPGAGWLGKLGLICAVGRNLFETLMLNLLLLRDGSNELWGEEKPIWESEKVRTSQREEIPMPDNLSELYTLQSRRLLLMRAKGKVTGYGLLGGDFFPKENAFCEQMTLWRNTAKKETDPDIYVPKRHSPERMLWRDFAPIAVQLSGGRRPGLVNFLSRLQATHSVQLPMLHFQTACVNYGDKDFFVDDICSDELSFNAELLTSLGEKRMPRITDAIDLAERLARQLGNLAADLEKCRGDTDGSAQRDAAKAQAYYALDLPFRRWLEGIDPANPNLDMDDCCEQWLKECQRQIRVLGGEMAAHAGAKAFIGRTALDRNKKEMRYTAPEVYNRFLYYTSEKYLKGEK